jgi:hypothetical protein
MLLVIIPDLDFVRILQNIRMYRLLDQLASSTSYLQNQIVQRRPSKNVNMIR